MGVLGEFATVGDVAARKRPEGRKNYRLTIEIYDQEADLMRRLRLAAVEDRLTLRDWVLAAIEEQLARRDPARDPSA
jgi:hypothetical protein